MNSESIGKLLLVAGRVFAPLAIFVGCLIYIYNEEAWWVALSGAVVLALFGYAWQTLMTRNEA